jgi:hypothetical protein
MVEIISLARIGRVRLADRIERLMDEIHLSGGSQVGRCARAIGKAIREETERPYAREEVPPELRAVPWLHTIRRMLDEIPGLAATLDEKKLCDAVEWDLAELTEGR